MGPSRCQTLLRRSPRALTQSPVGRNPADSLPSRRTSSTTTEELLAKIMKVMDVLEKDMKQRRTEFKQLKQRVRHAEKAQALAEDRHANLQGNVGELATSQASIIKCVVCQHCMEQPFTIVECGHSFCYWCLMTWFHALLEKQIHWRPSIPTHLKSAPFTADKIKQLVEEGHIYRPCYSCPLCRRAVRNKPVKVFLASDLIGAIGALVPQSFPEIPPLPADEDLWAGAFYKIGD